MAILTKDRFRKRVIDLNGPEGNAFYILGTARSLCKQIGIGVERTFQLHSPMIESILVKRKGDVRQAKLFYLRERSGKSARIKERLD